MSQAYLATFAGLLGAVIGSFSSSLTTLATSRAQARERERSGMRRQQGRLYADFITEAARLFGDALSHQKEDVAELVTLYALVTKMRLVASPEVIGSAEEVMSSIIETYQSPNRTLPEVHKFSGAGSLEPLHEFSTLCRRELAAI